MVSSPEIVRKIEQALSPEDWKVIESSIAEINQGQGRRAQKTLEKDIYNLITNYAFKNNKPELLLALSGFANNDIDRLFSQIILKYIITQDENWLKSVFPLSEKLGKKSYQSRVFAMMAKTLIEAGVSKSNAGFITSGMILLERISFRKYRSEVMIDIIPLLIEWAVITRDEKLLIRLHFLTEEISDISKRAVLNAELAQALASIAILEKNRVLFVDSLHSAAWIYQKIRRQACISSIVEKGARSVFGKELLDIALFIQNFNDLPEEGQLEIVGALTEQLLERVKDKSQIITNFQTLCERMPFVSGVIVINLLKKAELSGDLWYLSAAITLHQIFLENEAYPLRELVRAGVSVAKRSNNMPVLSDLIPIIDKNSNPIFLSRIYLQFSQIMLSSGDFSSALDIFRKISHETEILPQFEDSLTLLLKTGILKDRISVVNDTILKRLNKDIINNSIYRAIIELSSDNPFEDIISHSQSINELILHHPMRDRLILESIQILIDRGFLELHDPGILIQIAESIKEQGLKEQAISNIIIQIAKIGVQIKNRDYLQRAVGLTSEINDQETRSLTLSNIIDEASILAAEQGDLNLLLRMRIWSSSLLENNLASNAMINIIGGIIKYATDKQSPVALEEAYQIVKDIGDPALKTQQFERIAENFVTIGCTLLKEQKSRRDPDEFASELYPFERGLSIIKENVKVPWISLKIAGIIDIILSFSHISNNPDYAIPLAMFSAEIKNPLERDAMMSRIISNLNENLTYPDSTDSYEIMTFLLKRNVYSTSNPVLINLIFHFLQLIHDTYIRLTGLCNLAESFIKLHESVRAKEILDDVYLSVNQIQPEFQKILILSDLMILYSSIDPNKSKKCLDDAILRFESIESDKNSITRKRIVLAIVQLNAVKPNGELIAIVSEVSSKIKDPVEYIDSLIALISMVKNDREQCNILLKNLAEVVEKIPSPYEKASSLLDIIPFALQNSDDETAVMLLKKAEGLTRKINIQQIADIIRDKIAEMYCMLYQKHKNTSYLNRGIEITKTIDDDEIRLRRLTKMGQKKSLDGSAQHEKIKSLFEKIIEEGAHPNQIASLEKLIRSIADRGKEAILFCDVAVMFRKQGAEKIANRMLQSAIKESRIIRPLSKRAFVMCDIAMKTYASGCERDAQEILDLAIDAATNIRQSALRDEVFDELGLAIKLMQGM
jgi:hypothetical protein